MVHPDEAASAAPSSSVAPQAQAPPSQQNITVTYRQLNIAPFAVDRDPTYTTNRWDKGKKDLDFQFRFCGIHDSELKKYSLVIYSNHDIANLEDSLPDVETTDPPAEEHTKAGARENPRSVQESFSRSWQGNKRQPRDTY